MSPTLRSNCPIAASLDMLGDRWSLLVLRDLLLRGVSHYGDFVQEESISSNVLADRLEKLVESGIIERLPDPEDGRRVIYRPLAPAIELLPIITEFIAWGAKYTAVDIPPELGPLSDPKIRRAMVAKRTRQLMREAADSS